MKISDATRRRVNFEHYRKNARLFAKNYINWITTKFIIELCQRNFLYVDFVFGKVYLIPVYQIKRHFATISSTSSTRECFYFTLSLARARHRRVPKRRENELKLSLKSQLLLCLIVCKASQESNTLSSCYFEFRKSNNALFTSEQRCDCVQASYITL